MTRLGMESGAIADHQITAKNVLNGDYAKYGPELARLNGNSKFIPLPVSHAIMSSMQYSPEDIIAYAIMPAWTHSHVQ